jgi:FkbM family methyltransferase
VLWRLLDRGDTAADAGANIGVMTSLMAVRAGPTGCVHAFEPHPEIFEELAANHAQWSRPGLSPIRLRGAALSSRRGEGILCDRAEHFKTNRMVAQVRDDPETASPGEPLVPNRLCRRWGPPPRGDPLARADCPDPGKLP